MKGTTHTRILTEEETEAMLEARKPEINFWEEKQKQEQYGAWLDTQTDKDLKQAQNELQELEDELDRHDTELNDISDRIKSGTAEIAKLKDDIKGDISKRAARMNQLEKEVTIGEHSITFISASKNKLISEIQAKKQLIKSIDAQLIFKKKMADIQPFIDSLRDTLKAYKEAEKALELKINELELQPHLPNIIVKIQDQINPSPPQKKWSV